MADPTARDLEIIASVFSKVINDKGYAFDNIFPKTPVVNYLVARDKMDGDSLGVNNRIRKLDGGVDIEIPIEYGEGDTMQFFDGMDVITFTPQETTTNAKFAWAHAVGKLVLDNKDILKVNGDAAKITNFTGSKLRNMAKTMAKGINTALLATAPGAKYFHSIPVIVDEAPTSSSTIGGIQQATSANSWWRNQMHLSTATTWALLMKEIRNLRNTAAYNSGGDSPDQFLCDQIVYEYVLAWMDAKGTHTFIDTEMSKMLNMEVKKVEGMNLIWDTGVPLITSSKSTAYLLNTDYLQFCVHQDRMFKVTKPMDLLPGQGQDATAWAVFLMGQLTCSNRNKQGVIHGITTTLTS